ncbi:hypothetical protein [Prosthecobacter sp.]|uniref:hypothetical protein n=1 Tax=Prosthecobacter sp. TaxID=1965333 RepID=UPI003783CDD9
MSDTPPTPAPPPATLHDMVNASLAALAAEGKVEAIVRTHIEKAIGTAVAETISGYNSPFTKALKSYVETALPMDFTGIGLAGYNDLIIRTIKNKLDASLAAWVNKGIAEELGELLQEPPESIKLSELVQQFRKENRHENGDEITVHLKEDDGSLLNYWTLSLDPKPGKRKHDCELYMAVDSKGQIYSLKVAYRGDMTKGMFVGHLYGFERTLFRLWVGKTKIIKDHVNEWD